MWLVTCNIWFFFLQNMQRMPQKCHKDANKGLKSFQQCSKNFKMAGFHSIGANKRTRQESLCQPCTSFFLGVWNFCHSYSYSYIFHLDFFNSSDIFCFVKHAKNTLQLYLELYSLITFPWPVDSQITKLPRLLVLNELVLNKLVLNKLVLNEWNGWGLVCAMQYFTLYCTAQCRVLG